MERDWTERTREKEKICTTPKRGVPQLTQIFLKTSFKVLDNQPSMTFAYCCCFHYVLFVGGPLFLQQGYSAENSRGSSLDENSGQATNLCSSSFKLTPCVHNESNLK